MAAALVLAAALLATCGDDGAATTTTSRPRVEAVAQYCGVLEGAGDRASGDTMQALGAVALPEIADLIEGLLRYQSSGDDYTALGDFNEATCGIRFP